MRGKLLFGAGLALGYVVGARAGRPAYDALTARLDDVASSPRVHDAGASAKARLEEGAPAVAGALEQAARTAADAVAAAQAAPADPDAKAPDTSPAAGGDGGTPGDDSVGTTRTRTRRVRSSGGAPAKADD